ncbi:hypothetical protein E2C01_033176 [Portunus trituberculatus]|uniref:Uncharacterized protein n=1 Tax=Portunus trituberculatus TaxID=210409 RepID=A0A5B7EXY1_PORTR|nr:hypothetical protein [Portunus trituberculatus]
MDLIHSTTLAPRDDGSRVTHPPARRGRITSNANTQSLAESNLCSLVYCLIGESARPRHNTHIALLVDVARHDSNLALGKF